MGDGEAFGAVGAFLPASRASFCFSAARRMSVAAGLLLRRADGQAFRSDGQAFLHTGHGTGYEDKVSMRL